MFQNNKFSKNFKQHRREVISDFANSFRLPAYKSIWGITIKCNVKPQELCWLWDKILHYQEISECPDVCNQENPAFTISQYATPTNTPVFPQVGPLAPNCRVHRNNNCNCK